MKLSEMTTDQAADALLIIAPEMESILNDKAIIAMFAKLERSGDKEEAAKAGMTLALKMAVHLIKEHRTAMWNILGALSGQPAHEVGKQSLPATIKQIVDLVQDKDFMDFFRQSE